MATRTTSLASIASILAIVLNVIVYYFPEIFNSPGQCSWHPFATSSLIVPQYPIINAVLPSKVAQSVLHSIPWLRSKTHGKEALSNDIHLLAFGDPQINGNWNTTSYIKRLDNFGNDYYLGHIYSTMKARLNPSHVAVMGDMFLLQWILDSEFYNRTNRFVLRLFDRPMEYKRNEIETHARHENYDWQAFMEREHAMDPKHRFDSRVYTDMYDWIYPARSTPNYENPLFINLTGNHDIGYSGDATWQHMARFHHLFGQNNYVIEYNHGKPNSWRLVVLDSLTLEGPALQSEFLNYTWSFLENLEQHHNPLFKGLTVLLTHIPLYKTAGLCADGPEHRYYIDYEREPFKNGLLRSQNHLHDNTTQRVMDIVFPNPEQAGIILTGHDHVGCDSWYNFVNGLWKPSKVPVTDGPRAPVREVVVRSMMGDYNGQTGIFTGHFNDITQKWQFHFKYCSFTVQHWWWASKLSLIIAVFLQTLSWMQ